MVVHTIMEIEKTLTKHLNIEDHGCEPLAVKTTYTSGTMSEVAHDDDNCMGVAERDRGGGCSGINHPLLL